MSKAKPMGLLRRLDNYARQNGSEDAFLTPAQDRRRVKKQHRNGTDGIVWVYGGKNRPTPRQTRRRIDERPDTSPAGQQLARGHPHRQGGEGAAG